jgi:hypothetical protein
MGYTESSLGEGFVMVLLDATPSPIGEPLAEAPWLPTNLDSDEPPLETDWHRNQIDLLIRLLQSIGGKR